MTRSHRSARSRTSSAFPRSACSRTKRFRPPTRRSSTTSSARRDGELIIPQICVMGACERPKQSQQIGKLSRFVFSTSLFLTRPFAFAQSLAKAHAIMCSKHGTKCHFIAFLCTNSLLIFPSLASPFQFQRFADRRHT